MDRPSQPAAPSVISPSCPTPFLACRSATCQNAGGPAKSRRQEVRLLIGRAILYRAGKGAVMANSDTRLESRPPAEAPPGSNRPQPVRSLRDWLDHLAAHDRLAVIRDGAALRFDLAAIAKRLDGRRATVFPRPG